MKFSDTIDFDDADVIVIAGLNPSQWERVLPALDAGIRRRVSRGAKLIAINSGETRIASAADVNVQADEASTLAQLAKALIDKGSKADKDVAAAVSGLSLTEDIEKAAELIKKAAYPVIFCAPSLFNASRNLSLLLKIKVVAVPAEANARGVVAMGLTTDGKTYKEMASGGLDVLYTVGEVPMSSRPDVGFLIAQTSYLTELAKQADVVLPAATYLESEGTITGYLGKVKDVKKIIEPAGDSKQHKDIFIQLSKVLGTAIKSAAKIKSAREVNKPAFSPFEKKQGLDAAPASISEGINASIINHSKLLWLREAQQATV
jgi:predicted molibdopterin-dependent oxidoreductase YjgC